MPIQKFELLDYVAPVVVGVIFSIVLFLLSILINFLCIKKTDDITEFERLGAKYNIRAGPHRLSVVKACQRRRIVDDDIEMVTK